MNAEKSKPSFYVSEESKKTAEGKNRQLKTSKRIMMMLLVREEKIRKEIDKIYNKNPELYHQKYMKSDLKDDPILEMFIPQEYRTKSNKLIGIYEENFEKKEVNEMKQFVQLLEPKAFAYAKRKKIIDKHVASEVMEMVFNNTEEKTTMNYIKALLIPTIINTLDGIRVSDEEQEYQLKYLDTIGKRFDATVSLPSKMKTFTKEEKQQFCLPYLNSTKTDITSVLNEMYYFLCADEISKKFQYKEKKRYGEINLDQYEKVIKRTTDALYIKEGLSAVFDINGVALESYEKKIETKEIAELFRTLDKEVKEINNNEKNIIYSLMLVIHQLLKDKKVVSNKEKEMLEKETRELQNKINENEELRKQKEKVANLEKQLKEMERQKNVYYEEAKKVQEDNLKKNKIINELIDKVAEQKPLEDEVKALRNAFYKFESENNIEEEKEEGLTEKEEFLKEKKLLFVGGYANWKRKISENLTDAKIYSEDAFLTQGTAFMKNYDYIIINNLGIKHASTEKVTSVFENRNKVIFLIGHSNYEKTINHLYKVLKEKGA